MHDINFAQNKAKASLSTKKAQGTLNKVLKMIEEDKYCPEVIQQIDSTIGLLKSVKKQLLMGHLDHCIIHKLQEDKKSAIEELLKIYSLGEK
jgi:DNA-binding FrmR family transcriptional regulator